jgi:hypothetical protein
MPFSFPVDSITDASMKKLNIIYVSLIFAIKRWLYFSALIFEGSVLLLMFASWYEFFSLAPIFRMVCPFAGILMLLGEGTKSRGLMFGF